MSNSQKWAIWAMVFAVVFHITAFVGGAPGLAALIGVVGFLAARIGLLVVIAGALSVARRKA